MITKIHLMYPGDLRGFYLTKFEVDNFLDVLNLKHFKFLRPFSKIEFTVSGTHEIPKFGYLPDKTIFTIHYIRKEN